MKTIIGIQARSGSSRLPGKSIADIGGLPALVRCYNACMESGYQAYVLPPYGDSAIIDCCSKYNIIMHMTKDGTGESDVLERYVRLAKATRADRIVRITGDCPFPYLNISDSDVDFESNCFHPRWIPDGWDCEVMSNRCLNYARDISSQVEREHVTAGIYRAISSGEFPFTFHSVRYPLDLSNIKISIDTQEDLDRVRGMMI